MLNVLGDNYCLKIVTGNESYDSGTMEVSVNNVAQIQTKMFRVGEKVIYACFRQLESISIRNPTKDAWKGDITVTKGGKTKTLTCIKCGGTLFKRELAVLGDEADTKQSSTWCINGTLCTLILKGI